MLCYIDYVKCKISLFLLLPHIYFYFTGNWNIIKHYKHIHRHTFFLDWTKLCYLCLFLNQKTQDIGNHRLRQRNVITTDSHGVAILVNQKKKERMNVLVWDKVAYFKSNIGCIKINHSNNSTHVHSWVYTHIFMYIYLYMYSCNW